MNLIEHVTMTEELALPEGNSSQTDFKGLYELCDAEEHLHRGPSAYRNVGRARCEMTLNIF